MLLSHIISIVLLIGVPIWDAWELRILRTSSDPGAKARCYLRCILVLWLISFVTLGVMPLTEMWSAPQSPETWLQRAQPEDISAIVCFLMIGVFLPLILAIVHKGTRTRLLKQFDSLDYLLPQSSKEMLLFAGVSITAGICEEIIFRGYLLHYLHDAPWGLSTQISLYVVSIAFGFAHFGQGIKGIIITAFAGILLGGLYIITGNLLLPIIVHVAIDLRAIAMSALRNHSAQRQLAD